jgi:hypothetical protein
MILKLVCVPEESRVGKQTLICNSIVEAHTSKYASSQCPTNEYHFLKCSQAGQNSPLNRLRRNLRKLAGCYCGRIWRTVLIQWVSNSIECRVTRDSLFYTYFYINLQHSITLRSSVPRGGGVFGVFKPPSEIPKFWQSWAEFPVSRKIHL